MDFFKAWDKYDKKCVCLNTYGKIGETPIIWIVSLTIYIAIVKVLFSIQKY